MNLTVKAAKSNFFDRKKVVDKLSDARRRVLSKQGAEVRRVAQKSLKYAEGASSPGTPPHVHKHMVVKRTSKSTGKVRRRAVSPLREFLFFAYDAQYDVSVVGPVKLGNTAGQDVPFALEHGGTSRGLVHGKYMAIRIRARPYMQPALLEAKATLAPMWQNAVR